MLLVFKIGFSSVCLLLLNRFIGQVYGDKADVFSICYVVVVVNIRRLKQFLVPLVIICLKHFFFFFFSLLVNVIMSEADS